VLKSEAKLLEICDMFASGLSYRSSAMACGVAPRTLFQWLKQSNAGDEDFIIIYCDEQMQFSQAMALARKMLHMEVRANLERRSMLGHDEPIFFGGMPTFKPDFRTVGWTEDEREAYGFPRDGLLRDEQGRVIQNTIHREPPIEAVLRVLEMSFGEEYTPTTNTNVINKDTGVSRADPISDKMAVPPKPVRPQLEVLSDVPADEIDDLLGPEPEPLDDAEPDLDTDDDEPEAIAEPERLTVPSGPMIRTATPPQYQAGPNPLIAPRAGRPLSDLERDLLSKLPSSVNR
jgi:hypothetical protein